MTAFLITTFLLLFVFLLFVCEKTLQQEFGEWTWRKVSYNSALRMLFLGKGERLGYLNYLDNETKSSSIKSLPPSHINNTRQKQLEQQKSLKNKIRFATTLPTVIIPIIYSYLGHPTFMSLTKTNYSDLIREENTDISFVMKNWTNLICVPLFSSPGLESKRFSFSFPVTKMLPEGKWRAGQFISLIIDLSVMNQSERQMAYNNLRFLAGFTKKIIALPNTIHFEFVVAWPNNYLPYHQHGIQAIPNGCRGTFRRIVERNSDDDFFRNHNRFAIVARIRMANNNSSSDSSSGNSGDNSDNNRHFNFPCDISVMLESLSRTDANLIIC